MRSLSEPPIDPLARRASRPRRSIGFDLMLAAHHRAAQDVQNDRRPSGADIFDDAWLYAAQIALKMWSNPFVGRTGIEKRESCFITSTELSTKNLTLPGTSFSMASVVFGHRSVPSSSSPSKSSP